MTRTAPLNVGILLGSARVNSNGNGIASWVKSHLDTMLKTSDATTLGKTIFLPLRTYPLPLGPMSDDLVPKSTPLEDSKAPIAEDGIVAYAYLNQRDKDWSRVVQSLHGLVIVTPQYNWSIPGELKNTIDHLYAEWVGLPIATVSYGFAGGNKAVAALQPILEAIGAKQVSVGQVMVSVPYTYIQGAERMKGDEELLGQYEAVLREEMGKLIAAATERQGEKSLGGAK
jgi:NAD(P)H-dependent FMN reductase